MGEDQPPGLIRDHDEGSDLEDVKPAAEQVARVEQDDKYFGSASSPPP